MQLWTYPSFLFLVDGQQEIGVVKELRMVLVIVVSSQAGEESSSETAFSALVPTERELKLLKISVIYIIDIKTIKLDIDPLRDDDASPMSS